MEERTKQLLNRRPYLSSWFEDRSSPPPPKTILHSHAEPLDAKLVEQLIAQTPSQIAVGRTGTRFQTKHSLAMRVGHAIAKDAVYSEVGETLISKLVSNSNCITLHSQNTNREDYLLNPGKGRRLNEESIERLVQEGTPDVDVQVIIGDGLAAWAVERNIEALLPVLYRELAASSLTTGKLLFVRFARVGIQDHIGTLLRSKATVILLGERPGLGTGDSLSAYVAYGPKIDQDNSDKNCISNIRQLGILPEAAAIEIVDILKRAFAAGAGGVAIV